MKNNKSEKELHMQLWKESGLSKVEYATQSGLNPHSFYGWFKKAKPEPQSTTEFVELHRNEKSYKTTPDRIKITLAGGYEITIAPGFDRVNLCTILDVLECR